MKANEFFEALWQNYVTTTPQAKKIKSLFESLNETIVNDHVAFRTLSNSPIEIKYLQPLLESMGYEEQGQYVFEQKKLLAKSYSHSDKNIPKIFISELQRHLMPKNSQDVLSDIVSQIPEDATKGLDVFYQGTFWQPVSWEAYQSLVTESEYAGWFSYMGLRANHFTVSLNHLKHYTDMNAVIDLLIENGFDINPVGGVIKGKPEDLLTQSSTMADQMSVTFASKDKRIVPTCFYEFAQRYKDSKGHLFEGFITNNADKIFESTDTAN